MPETPPASSRDGEFFLEIESAFAEKRGTPFILSAKDYALMQKWNEEGIPLSIVLEAIAGCFEKNGETGRRRTISSLSYCRHAVKDLWNERRDLSVGAGGSLPEADPLVALRALAESLRRSSSAMAPELEGIFAEEARAIEDLGKARSVPEIEEALISAEEKFLGRLVESLPAPERNKIERDIEKALGASGKLDEAVRKKTADANRRRLVRKRFAVPRFSLFG